MATTNTPLVPLTNVSFSKIRAAFPGLLGAASNMIGDYYSRYPVPTVPASSAVSPISFGNFKGITALTPSFAAMSNVPVPPLNRNFPTPVSGTNAVVLAGGLVTCLVGGASTYASSVAFDLLNYLDNNNYHLGDGTCTFAVQSGTLPTGATLTSAANGTLTLSTSSTIAYNQTVVFKCTNFYGNLNTATIKFNLVPALYYGGALAIYTGESFCPATGLWADVTGGGRTATTTGAISQSTVNGRTTIYGGTAATVTFPAGVLPATYTLVHIAKYNGAAKKRLVTSADGTNWASGHIDGFTGVSYHNGYLTANGDFGGGATWAMSSDQNSTYRCNGMALGSSGAGSVTTCRLGVNTYAGQESDWSVALVAVYPSALSTAQLYNVEQALAAQYGMAWKSNEIGSTVIGNNSYNVGLTGVFQNCTSYGVTSNPKSNTTTSGSTMSTVGGYRNTTYNVQMSGTAANGSVVLTTFNIIENQQPPSTSSPGTQVLYTGGSIYCPSFSSGPGLWYSCSGGYAGMSANSIYLNTSQRNTSYTVYMTAYNQRYDGGNQQSSVAAFTVYENQQPPYVTSNPGTLTYNGGGSVSCPSYFGGPGLWHNCGGGYSSMSGNTANFNCANRNTAYTVTIYAYNKRFDGGNQLSASTAFTVYENQLSPYVYATLGTQSDVGGGGWNVASYISPANGSSYYWSCDGGWTYMSGSTCIGNTANRNTYYWVNMHGHNYRYDGSNKLTASTSFLLYESQQQPGNSGHGNPTTSGTGNNDYYPSFQLGNGSNTQWSVNSNHPNWQSLGSGIRIWADYRNTQYWVTITATTYRFDGGTPKSTSVTFYVTEPVRPNVCVDCSGEYKDVYNSEEANVWVSVRMNTLTGRGTVVYHWSNGAGDYQYADIVSTGYYDFYWSTWNANGLYTGQSGWYDGQFYWRDGAFPGARWNRR